MENLQLASKRKEVIKTRVVGRFGVSSETVTGSILFQTPLPHLELSDPGTVPVGLRNQLYKELPLSSALHGWWRRGVRRGIGRRGNWDGIWRLTPSPVEDPLDASFDWWALKDHAYEVMLYSVLCRVLTKV